MTGDTLILVLSVLLAVCVLGWVVTAVLIRGRLSSQKALYEARLAAADAAMEQESRHCERTIAALRQANENALEVQIGAIRAEMTAQTEKILKEREQQLSARAEETFKSITGGLDKDLREMKQAFDADRQAHVEGSATLKARVDEAVRSLETQTRSIGDKADHLAGALRGQNKLQGCWGETILGNILESEGLVEGRDYDREQTLRDELGFVIHNDDQKRMRPDFILHYPDNTDIIIDSKVSLNALSDYMETEDPQLREDARRRNLAAVREQVKNLSRKDYSHYLASGRRTLDYVVMFIPNYAAFQLARELEPGIWREAFRQNVLITTEETLMPFLRMIRTAWISVEQVRNQQQIISAAQTMIDRVSEFSKAYATVGNKLQDALKAFDDGDRKLRDSGRSIAVSARRIVSLGVPRNPKKPLPELFGSEEEDGTPLSE